MLVFLNNLVLYSSHLSFSMRVLLKDLLLRFILLKPPPPPYWLLHGIPVDDGKERCDVRLRRFVSKFCGVEEADEEQGVGVVARERDGEKDNRFGDMVVLGRS